MRFLLTLLIVLTSTTAAPPAPTLAASYGSNIRDCVAKLGAPTSRETNFNSAYYTWKKDGIEFTILFTKNVATNLSWRMEKFKLKPDEVAAFMAAAKPGEWKFDDTLEAFRNGDLIALAGSSLEILTFTAWKERIEAEKHFEERQKK